MIRVTLFGLPLLVLINFTQTQNCTFSGDEDGDDDDGGDEEDEEEDETCESSSGQRSQGLITKKSRIIHEQEIFFELFKCDLFQRRFIRRWYTRRVG